MNSIFDEKNMEKVKKYIRKDKPEYYFVFILLLECGLNLDTIFNLTIDDVIMRNDEVFISVTTHDRKKEYSVPAEIEEPFFDFVKRRESLAVKNCRFLFCTATGNRTHQSRFSVYLTSAGKKLGIDDLNSRNLKKIYLDRLDLQIKGNDSNANYDIADYQFVVKHMAEYCNISSDIHASISENKLNGENLDKIKKLYIRHISELEQVIEDLK